MAHTYDENALTFFKNKQYTREGQSLEERISEITEKVREYEDMYSPGLADRIKDMIERKILIPSTPQWSNFGRPKDKDSKTQPLNCSCNIVNYTDSIAGIYFTHGEIAMLSKLGAGVGASFLHVSETGTEIDKGFFSNDKLDWIEDSVRVAQKVSQTNRRGYTVPFISIEDKSFYKLMERADKKNPDKKDPLVTNNVGIILPEDFWDKLPNNPELKKRYLQVIQQRREKGKIYLLDVRNCNKNLSPVYEKLGHKVDTTNICCVTGGTKVLTNAGEVEIKDLVGKETVVWNGSGWSKVKPFSTGVSDNMYKVTVKLKDPSDEPYFKILYCTDYHKWFRKDNSVCLTNQLVKGDLLIDNLTIDGHIVTQEVFDVYKVDLGEVETFCFHEEEKHRGVFNGILTGQCEIVSPSYEDKTMTCIIASLNLVHWDEIEKNPQMIKDAYMFLDINVEEYIKLTDGVPFLERARKSAIEKRDIGLGTMALHSLFQQRGFAFGDIGSRILNNQIYSTLREVGEEYAKEMGEKLGSPLLCQEAGLVRRNVSLLAIAPNKSSAMFAGNVSGGVEPYISNYFVNDLAGVHSVFKNPYLKEVLKRYEKDTVEVWESISKNSGSVQHLDFLDKEYKDVFRTANEISPKDMIDLASDRQRFIDMAQSLNLFGRPNYTLQDVYNIHKYAFDKGIKTLYYYYPAGHASIEKTNGESWDDCVSCAD